MRQLILYILFLVSMVFSGYGEVSAASISFTPEDSYTEDASHKKDGLAKVEYDKSQPEAQLENASQLAYRICAAVRSAYCQVATCTTVRLPVDCLQIESVIYHPFYQL